jgi:hypothetical protein
VIVGRCLLIRGGGDEKEEQSAGDGKTEAEEMTEDKLKDGEFMLDPIGKEIMSVGRAQYSKIKPLMKGDYAVMDARGNVDNNEKYWVAKAVGYNAVEEMVKVWWHGHPGNKETSDAKENKWYKAEVKKPGSTKCVYIKPQKPPTPVSKAKRYVGWVHQSTIFYWNDNILTGKGQVRHAQLKRVEARLDLVCNNTPMDKDGRLM